MSGQIHLCSYSTNKTEKARKTARKNTPRIKATDIRRAFNRVEEEKN